MDNTTLQILRELYYLYIKEASLTQNISSNSAVDFLAWLDQQINGYDQNGINSEIKDKLKKTINNK